MTSQAPVTPPVAQLTEGQIAYQNLVSRHPEYALWGGDPKCNHEEIDAPGGGVRCKYCPAWFCF